MSAYILVRAVITNRQKFAAYIAAVTPLVAEFGGSYKIIAGSAEPLEGEWPGQWREYKWVVHEWPSVEAARAFWYSPQYREVKKLREGCGQFQVLLLDDLPPPA